MKIASIGLLPNRKSLPVLSDNRRLRYFTLIVLYFAQGIPEGMTLFGIPAWMAMNGKTPGEIGSYVAMVMVPFTLKILAAPWMERYTYLKMGRRRPWLLVGQFGLMLSFAGLSMLNDPLNNMGLLIATVIFLHVFILIQDISTDSLVIDIVPLNEQARANGLMWGAKVIGTSTSLALGTWLINHHGFSTAVLILSFFLCLIMVVPLLLRERSGESLLPWTEGKASEINARLRIDSWKKIFGSLVRVVKLPNGILLALATFVLITAFAMMRNLLPIFTIQGLGWNNERYSEVFAITNLVSGVVGMVVGGLLINRYGRIRMIQVLIVLASVLITVMSFSQNFWHNMKFAISFLGIFNLLFVLSMIAILSLAMQFCWKRISAIQFTFYMTVFNMGHASGAALIGPLRKHLNWEGTLLAFPVLIALALVLLWFIQIDHHMQQVEDLEKSYRENNVGSLLTNT